MQTLYYPEFERLEIREHPVPEPGPGEVLLEVAACGLCGSELETFKARSVRRLPPLILGHEFCGTVRAVGDGANAELIGERFISNAVVHCGDCPCCRRGDTHLCGRREVFGMHRPGAFAEFVVVPEAVLIPWPEALPARAACLAEPLANGVHMVHLTRHLAAEKIVVIGAGPIGVMALQAFRAMRHSEALLVDLAPERLEVGRRLGAARVANPKEDDVPEQVADWTAGDGVDLVVDAAGSQLTKRLSIDLLRPGGAAIWIGLHADSVQIDSYGITLPEKQIFGTYSARQSELAEAATLMAEGKVDAESWTTVEPLDRGVDVFHRMLHPGPNDLKGVLLPKGDA